MAFKTKLSLFLFFFFICITTLALAHHQQSEHDIEREYQQCLQRCQEQKQEQQQQQQQQQCEQRCEKHRQEQEERHEREHQGGSRDPQQEYQQCQRHCQQEPQQQQEQCQQRCEQERQEQEERQREQGGNRRDPQQEYQQCQRQCQEESRSRDPQQQQQCQKKCEERRQEQERQQQEYQQCQQRCQQEEQGQGQQEQQQRCQQRCVDERQRQEQRDNAREQQQQGEERNNPYFLDEQSFKERLRTEHGSTRVSRRFTKISNLLRGIENYRLVQFEANPSTFVIPHHVDADAILVVVQGRGLINLVHQQDRVTYNLERGDVIRVPAGAVMYSINTDNNDKLRIVTLFKPVSTPTNKFREFFGPGGENPETFYNTFSDEILQAAFNTDRRGLDSLFRQRNGAIVQASQEQIRALSRDASSSQQGSRKWSKHGSQSGGPVNLLNQRPTHSNEYGQLYDVTPNDYPQLQDLDLAVSYHKINKGAMVAPFYNSRATSLVVVVNGNGRFEMASPHLSSSQSQSEGREKREQEQKQGVSVHYQKVSARLSPRTAFIVPAGHPVSIVASDNENLEVVAFKIDAENNQRNYLAGQNNLLNQLQREAKELAFNRPAREVEAILNNQKQSVFLPGPHQRQQREQPEEGRHGGLLIETIADVLAF